MGGRNRQAEAAQERLSGMFEGAMRQQLGQSERSFARMESLQQPMISFMQRIAGGDSDAALAAAAPQIAQLTRAQRAYEGNIYETTTHGPMRDFMMATAGRAFGSEKAQTLNDLFRQSLEGLAQFGMQYGDLGLAQMGAATQFGTGAGEMNRTLIDAATQRAAARWNAFGQLASALGYALGRKAG